MEELQEAGLRSSEDLLNVSYPGEGHEHLESESALTFLKVREADFQSLPKPSFSRLEVPNSYTSCQFFTNEFYRRRLSLPSRIVKCKNVEAMTADKVSK